MLKKCYNCVILYLIRLEILLKNPLIQILIAFIIVNIVNMPILHAQGLENELSASYFKILLAGEVSDYNQSCTTFEYFKDVYNDEMSRPESAREESRQATFVTKYTKAYEDMQTHLAKIKEIEKNIKDFDSSYKSNLNLDDKYYNVFLPPSNSNVNVYQDAATKMTDEKIADLKLAYAKLATTNVQLEYYNDVKHILRTTPIEHRINVETITNETEINEKYTSDLNDSMAQRIKISKLQAEVRKLKPNFAAPKYEPERYPRTRPYY